jgi:hypothetical protein
MNTEAQLEELVRGDKQRTRMYVKKDGIPDPKKVFPDCPHIINYAFSIAGPNMGERDFFWLDNFHEVPIERGFQCLTHFNEMKMKCSEEFLQAHSQAVINIGNDDKKTNAQKVNEILRLNEDLQDRLKWLGDLDIAYRLCSVVFFDAQENPTHFSQKRAGENAVIFREVELASFFFCAPISKLMPYFSGLGSDLPTYFEAMVQMNRLHLERVFAQLSGEDQKKRWASYLLTVLKRESTPQ